MTEVVLTVAGTSTPLFRTSCLPMLENGLAVSMMLLQSAMLCSTSPIANAWRRTDKGDGEREDAAVGRPDGAAVVGWPTSSAATALGTKLSQTAGRAGAAGARMIVVMYGGGNDDE